MPISRTDAAVGAVLLVASLALGTWYVPQVVAAGGKPRFYQEFFGTAVMLACGQGYVNPDSSSHEELRQFLSLERDEIACDGRLAAVAQRPLDAMQTAYRYLMTTVGWTWRLQGHVAWSRLAPLYGVFFAATIVLLFAVFRQGMGTIISAALAIVIAVSPLHVMYLAHLRDYSKAPFVLALVFLAMRLVMPPQSLRRALTLAAVAGVVTGIGMGYRNDLLVAVPALVVVLAVFLPPGGFPRGWRSLAPPALYLAAFVLALSPMWSIYRTGGGNSSQHLIVLGLGEPFSDELGVDSGGTYEWGYDYRDEYAYTIIGGHAARQLAIDHHLPIYGREYDLAATDYLKQVLLNFPADMLTRAYASVVRVIELPYNQKLMLPHVEYIRIPYRALIVRDRFQRALAPFWPSIVALTLFCLSLASLRLGLFAILLVFYLSGYPALQFGERHYFHLEFVSWWALGFIVSLIAGGARAAYARGFGPWLDRLQPASGWRTAAWQASAMLLIVAVVLVAPLEALRRYQQPHLAELFERYATAPLDAPPLVSDNLGNGFVRFRVPQGSSDPQAVPANGVVHPELFMAEFGGAGCDSLKLDATFRYQASLPSQDFSRTIQVQPPLSKTPLQVFFPAYSSRPEQAGDTANPDQGFRLTGVELQESARGCLTRLGRLVDLKNLPLLFELRLAPQWQRADHFQTIDGVESRTNAEEVPVVYTFPPDLEVGRHLLMDPLQPLLASAIYEKSPTLDTSLPTWTNSGVGGVGGKGPYLYLFEMKPETMEEGRLALIQGYITRGGVSFGLVSNRTWIAQAGVTRPGEFTIVVRVPVTGTHSLVLANNLPNGGLENDLVIRRVGWINAPKARGTE